MALQEKRAEIEKRKWQPYRLPGTRRSQMTERLSSFI